MSKANPVAYAALLFFSLLLAGCELGEQAVATWEHAPEGVYSAALSHDGRYAIAASVDGYAKLWDVSKNRLLHTLKHTGEEGGGIIDSEFSQDGRFVLTAERETLALWKIDTGKHLGFWVLPPIRDIAVSARGRYALIGFKDNLATYLDLGTGQFRWVFRHRERVSSVALSGDGRYALTGSEDGIVKLWSLENGDLLHLWQHAHPVRYVALSPSGALALTNEVPGETQIWDTGSGELRFTLPSSGARVSAAAFSSKDQRLLTGHAGQGIILWDIDTGLKVQRWRPKLNHGWRPGAAIVLSLAFSEGEREFISATAHGVAQRWRLP